MARDPSLPTLAQIARAAGVSRMAASVVLNGSRSGTRVSSATARRIVEAARLLGHPGPRATPRPLRTVGIFTGYNRLTFDSPFAIAILRGLQGGCALHGLDLVLHGRIDEPQHHAIAYHDVDHRVDALVLWTRPDEPGLRRLLAAGTPLVTIADDLDGVPGIGVDEHDGGRQLARHLARRGHRRVLWRESDQRSESQARRHQGFVAEAAALGMDVLYGRRSMSPQPFSDDEVALLTREDDRRASAVAAFADYLAWPLISDALRRGWAMPHQVAIAGFDGADIPLAPPPIRALTTIVADWVQVGYLAIDRLVASARNEDVPMRTVLPVTLRHGVKT
jgi:LacI family transcriptional regulator